MLHELSGERPRKYAPLPPEFKAKWVEALRSGTYPQGRSKLRKWAGSSLYSYSALGVAKDLQNPHWKLNTQHYCMDLKTGEHVNYVPAPDEVVICSEALWWFYRKQPHLSFPQIADWIEANL